MRTLHTHYSATAAAGAFLSVVILGTAWRLGWAHAIAQTRFPWLQTMGKAALVQY